MKRKALILGVGAREHALARRLALEGWEVACAPGNAGIARTLACHPVLLSDLPATVALARTLAVDLVVVGPEAPLVLGIADALEREGIPTFGPSAAAARLEGSKAFAKELMIAAGVPTASHRVFDDKAAALAHARALGGRLVVKADGLAAGKGVTVCTAPGEAEAALEAALVRREFGEAGRVIVLEELLVGRELSLMALCDGRDLRLLPLSQDHKRVGDGDRGPNTGGMGAVSPPFEPPPLSPERLAELALSPVLDLLRHRGTPFRGALYAGLMLTPDGPKVLEYNCRLGDPETQVLVERIDGDLGEALLAAARGSLAGHGFTERPLAAVGVVLCAQGYPGRPSVGDPILGLADAEREPGAAILFGAVGGTPDRPVTAGGRVLTAVGTARDLPQARQRAYRLVERIHFPGSHHRSDLGAS